MDERKMTEGQRAYEAKRAAKAGVSLDKWLAQKEKQAKAEREAEARAERSAPAASASPGPRRKPGFFARLLERAQKPL